ncbi:MAG: nucleoside triphosphate pyrophosphohydrolase [Anaerolineales bacterium]|jgi:tetrapyrrole methylase family protein/MazG family protein
MAGITILGLGPGSSKHLTREAWEVLQAADEIYLRTSQHPTVSELPGVLIAHSFDDIYTQETDFSRVYERIVEQVLKLGRRSQGVLYAVPGHPYTAEATCPEIIHRAQVEGIPTRVVEGLSFLEPIFTSLRIDPLPQTTIVDALELVSAYYPKFPPDAPALVAQLYSPVLSGEVKITLMSQYPDEHPVRLVHAAGTPEAVIEEVPLYQIDQSEHIGLLTSLYIPPLGDFTSYEGFQGLIAHLRSPEGCPWDREQNHQSLRTNLMEESYEALSAIDADDPVAMQEEFGDLLLQVVLQTQIAAEYGEFSMADVIRGIHTKLVRRHPHVFEDTELEDAEAVIKNWEKIKAAERKENGEEVKGLLDGIPIAMPALSVADLYQRRAARVGFDWTEMEDVLEKLEEELSELRAAGSEEERNEEFGDLLFALVNAARWWGIDAESALRETNAKFRRRFARIESEAKIHGRLLSDLTLEEMDAIWEQTKKE